MSGRRSSDVDVTVRSSVCIVAFLSLVLHPSRAWAIGGDDSMIALLYCILFLLAVLPPFVASLIAHQICGWKGTLGAPLVISLGVWAEFDRQLPNLPMWIGVAAIVGLITLAMVSCLSWIISKMKSRRVG